MWGPPGRIVERTRPRAGWLLPGLLAAVVLLATLSALFGESVTHQIRRGDGLRTVDQPVADWMVGHRTAWLTTIMRVVTTLGSPLGVTLTAVAVVGIAEWRSRRLWPAVLTVVVLGGAHQLQTSIKALVARPRPSSTFWADGVSASGFSFPSGHATVAAAGYGLIAALLAPSLRSVRERVAGWAAAAAATATVGLSRVYLGVPWLSDVVAGWLLGALWLGLVQLVVSQSPARDTRRS